MMQVVMKYLYQGVEYLVCEVSGYTPGTGAIELLGSRKYGVGGDRILTFAGICSKPSFRVFSSTGEELDIAKEDCLIFAYYLRRQNIFGNAGDLEDSLDDQILGKAEQIEKNIYTAEVHLTSYVCCKMMAADRKTAILAG